MRFALFAEIKTIESENKMLRKEYTLSDRSQRKEPLPSSYTEQNRNAEETCFSSSASEIHRL